MATPPDKALAIAALDGVTVAGVEVELADPVVAVVFETTLVEVETVVAVDLPLVGRPLELEVDEVAFELAETLGVEVAEAVYEGLLETATVVVDAEPVTEEELALERPEMWNGKLYWKIESWASRESLKP